MGNREAIIKMVLAIEDIGLLCRIYKFVLYYYRKD